MIRAFSLWDSMRIACPSCAAEYEVPASRLKPGKLVRCARCGGKWLPDPDPEPVASEGDLARQIPPDTELGAARSLPDVTAMDRLAASRAATLDRKRLIAAWALTFVVLAGAVAAVVGWRDDVVRTWPPSGRILAATGQSVAQPAQTGSKKPE
jgi:predicted Zn finger-like uncharacterized protein